MEVRWIKMKKHTSLRYRMMVLLGGVLFLLCTVVIAYNFYISQMVNKQINHVLENTLRLYTQEVTTSLDNVESFLLTQCMMEEDIRKLHSPRKEIDRYLAQIDVNELFQVSIDNYNLLDGLFMYEYSDDIFLGQAKSNMPPDTNKIIRRNMPRFLTAFKKSSIKTKNTWFSLVIDEEYYLVKLFEKQGVYVGSYIKVKTILDKLSGLLINQSDYILMSDFTGKIMDVEFDNMTKDTQKNYYKLQVSSEKNGFSFVVLQKNRGENALVKAIGIQILVGAAFITLACAGGFGIFQRFLTRPLQNLVSAMRQLGNGNPDVKIDEESLFDEFKIVNETFKHMITEIKKLKIDVYEEMLHKQKAELLYLQEQINPHFLTNCMNLIRNLSIMEEHDKVQEACILLSKYMRFTLSNSTEITIERELEHVETYRQLQAMRYGDGFLLYIHMKKEMESYMVPNMLIQTFVDNSIKHQMDPAEQLKVEITICMQKKEGKEGISIIVMDSGEGFSKDILEKLQKNEILGGRLGEHIGIYNVKQRLEILYGNEASLLFYNASNAGAVVNIFIPNQPILDRSSI